MTTKTPINVNISKDLKDQFYALAQEFGTNPSNLIRMFIKQTVRTRKIEFSVEEESDIWVLHEIDYEDLPASAKKEYDKIKDWNLEDFEKAGYSSLV